MPFVSLFVKLIISLSTNKIDDSDRPPLPISTSMFFTKNSLSSDWF